MLAWSRAAVAMIATGAAVFHLRSPVAGVLVVTAGAAAEIYGYVCYRGSRPASPRALLAVTALTTALAVYVVTGISF